MFLAQLGCARGARPAADSAAEPAGSEQETLPATVVTEREAESSTELLARAEKKLLAEDFQGALVDYRLVLSAVEKGPEYRAALLGEGTTLDLSGKPREALDTYLRYLADAPPEQDARPIQVRVIRLLVYLEQYEQAARRAENVSLDGLTSLQQLAVLGAKSLGALSQERIAEAEGYLSRGRSLIDTHSLDRVQVPPLDVAVLFFALGEVHRKKASEVTFSPPPDPFAPALEARCQHILDAQAAYSTAMRSGDIHFSSMAGVRVGHLYQHLHEDLMKVPIPVEADTPARRILFEGAMRLRYSILLNKAVAMMKSTVFLLERTDHQGAWADRARESLAQIERAQKQEEAALDALPYSREQLQTALDDLKARALKVAPQSGG